MIQTVQNIVQMKVNLILMYQDAKMLSNQGHL